MPGRGLATACGDMCWDHDRGNRNDNGGDFMDFYSIRRDVIGMLEQRAHPKSCCV